MGSADRRSVPAASQETEMSEALHFATLAIAYARAHPHPELRDRTVWEVFEAERPSLVRYAGPFDGFHAVPAAVSKTCLVRFDGNKYSVSASAVGRPVEVRAYAERIELRQDGRVVGEHRRVFGRGHRRARAIRRVSCPREETKSGAGPT